MNRPTAPSPWLPTAPCTPDRCAAHPHTGGDHDTAGTALAVLRLAAGTGTVLLGILLAPAAALLPPAARPGLVRTWVRAVVRAFGVHVRYEGTAPATGPLLVVANHVSWLDIPLVAALLPGRMVAKAEVRGWPVLGGLASLGGTLFLDRDGLRALPGTVREMTGVLARGGRVVVFPEGSTWCGRAAGRFRPAAFQAALDSGADVQPVRIDYRPTGAAAYVGDDPPSPPAASPPRSGWPSGYPPPATRTGSPSPPPLSAPSRATARTCPRRPSTSGRDRGPPPPAPPGHPPDGTSPTPPSASPRPPRTAPRGPARESSR